MLKKEKKKSCWVINENIIPSNLFCLFLLVDDERERVPKKKKNDFVANRGRVRDRRWSVKEKNCFFFLCCNDIVVGKRKNTRKKKKKKKGSRPRAPLFKIKRRFFFFFFYIERRAEPIDTFAHHQMLKHWYSSSLPFFYFVVLHSKRESSLVRSLTSCFFLSVVKRHWLTYDGQ